jgi:putative spermidine/putrescine transport system permease protein
MVVSARTRLVLRLLMALGLAFLYVPLAIVVLNAFNESRTFAFPPTGYTLNWWHRAWDNDGAREGLINSVKAGLGATAIALVLGTMAAFAVQRYRFFGRSTVSFLVILPIALPGIVTGIALQNAFHSVLAVQLSIWTIIVGHATFCVVVVFNNVIARLRRVAPTAEEASMDLGADTFTTFRRITFPAIRTALIAGGLLAFALSFDEIIVTNFTAGAGTQTLPLWIFTNYQRPNNLPLVNVAAVFVLALSIVPVWIASRLTSAVESTGR